MHDQVLSIKGRHYRTGEPIIVEIEGGRIVQVRQSKAQKHFFWIGPGLIDLQVNGYFGVDFNTTPLSYESILQVTQRLWQEGVTTYLPTVITNSDENIEALLRSISNTIRHNPLLADTIAGIHLEGPFISPIDGPRGAHDRRYVKPPDWDLFKRWLHVADGQIRLVTLSPEWPNATSFIENCTEMGVKVAIGHTAANTDQIKKAVRAGASLSTHLGNGAHPVLPRHPNYIWDQLAEDALWASVIADGFHLPEAVLKVFMCVKRDKIFLISDVVHLGGLKPGHYTTHIGGSVVLTHDGKLHLAHDPQLLAGSVQTLRECVGNMVSKGLCTISEAWEMASVRPAKYLGVPVAKDIAPGEPADLVLFEFDHQVRIIQTIKSGVMVHSTEK